MLGGLDGVRGEPEGLVGGGGVALDGRFGFEGGEELGGGGVGVEVVEGLADGAEVAGDQVGDGVEAGGVGGGKGLVEHPVEEGAFGVGGEVAEAEFQGEAAQDGRVETVHEVRRGNEDALEVLDGAQELVDLGELPGLASGGAFHEKAVGFIEEQDGVFPAGAFEGPADELLGLANV